MQINLSIKQSPLARLALVFIVVAATMLYSLTFAKPAYAAAPDTCYGLGFFCLYEHTYYGGNQYIAIPNVGQCVNLSATWNDKASSLWNSASSTVRVYRNANCNSTYGYYDYGVVRGNSNLQNSCWIGGGHGCGGQLGNQHDSISSYKRL